MKTRNPYNNTRKRKAALTWMAARGITQPRALYPNCRCSMHMVTPEPVSAHKIVMVRGARLTFARPRVVS